MQLAILKGDGFNPWHLEAFQRHTTSVDSTVFHTAQQVETSKTDTDHKLFRTEALYRDNEAGPLLQRWKNQLAAKIRNRSPRILPFHNKLKKFDLIHTWELFTDWSDEAAEAHLRYDIPLIATVWDNIPFNMERDPSRRSLKARVAVNVDRFIVHTERSRRALDIEGVDPAKVVKIEPGVDTERFAPGPRSREQLDVENDDFVILIAGWYLPRKGIDFVLLALRELLHDSALSKQRPVRLLVVGAGNGTTRMAEMAERLKVHEACIFAGPQSYTHMPRFFRAADAFVLPGITAPEWQEHYGMLLIEAMACGVPVVSTQSGAAIELGEDAALLCQPNDFVSMYETLKELMLDPSLGAQLGEKGRELALRRFRIEGHAEAVLSVYDELLSGR